MDRLLDDLRPGREDALILVGDLLDKGPEPAAVVNLLGRLAQQQRVILVEGNHEERFLRWYHHLHHSPDIAARFPDYDALAMLAESIDDAGWKLLRSGRLWHRLNSGGVVVVHAGVPAAMQQLPPADFRSTGYSSNQRKWILQLMHLRYVDECGRPVALDREQPCHHFWAEDYDGRFGHLLFGHQAWPEAVAPIRFPHATGIDLGAVHGGSLCAMIFDSTGNHWHAIPAVICHSPARSRNPELVSP